MRFALAFSMILSLGCAKGLSVGYYRGADMGKISDTVIAVAACPQGDVFVGTDNGLGHKSGGSWLTKWPGWQVTAATAAGPKAAYVGVVLFKTVVATKAQMREARVYRIFERGGDLKEAQLAEPMTGDQIDALFVSRAGKLYVAARNRGVLTHDKADDVFKPLLGLSELGGRATGFAEGPDGTLYIGSFGGGVHVVKDGKIAKSYTPQNSDLRGNGVVRSVAFHPTMGLFVATANKLPGATVGDIEAQSQGTGGCQLVGDKWKNWTAGEGLKSNDVSKVAVAPDGSVWFLTLNAGASVFKGGQWLQPQLAGEAAYDISFWNEHAWVGTSGGLTHVSGY